MSIELEKKQGLIAGNGQLPVSLAKNAKENGFEVVAISLSSDNRNELKKYCAKVYDCAPGEVLKIKNILSKICIFSFLYMVFHDYWEFSFFKMIIFNIWMKPKNISFIL